MPIFDEQFSPLFSAGGHVTIEPGTYEVDKMIDVDSAKWLHVHAEGVTFTSPHIREGRRGVQLLHLKNCFGVTIDGLTIEGPKPDGMGYRPKYEGAHGVGIHACSYVTLNNLVVKNVCGDGVYIASVGGWKNATPSRSIIVANSYFHEMGRHGVAATGVDGLVVVGNTFSNFHRLWLDNEDRVKADTRRNIRARRDENTIIPAPKDA